MSTLKVKLNASGFSLIEVVASIVILSVIVISIFSLLMQSAKTTSNSENIIDATYIAQTEMEKAYAVAYESSLATLVERLKRIQDALNYPTQTPTIDGDKQIIERTEIRESNTEFIIRIELSEHNSFSQLTPILIKVFEKKDGNLILKAQMENTLAWKADA